MAMNFEADFGAIFNIKEFGDTVELPDGTTTIGILELNPIVLEDGQSNISTNTQLLYVRTSVGDALGQGDEVVINNVTYAVSDIRPDGTGVSELTLHRV